MTGYLVYGLVSVMEGTLFYGLVWFVLDYLDIHLPPIGSSEFFIFVVIWPLAAPFVRPGLQTIPFVNYIFYTTESIAKSAFPEQQGEQKPTESTSGTEEEGSD